MYVTKIECKHGVINPPAATVASQCWQKGWPCSQSNKKGHSAVYTTCYTLGLAVGLAHNEHLRTYLVGSGLSCLACSHTGWVSPSGGLAR